jgi:hypothetical protein
MCVRAINEKGRHWRASSLQGGSAIISQPPAALGAAASDVKRTPQEFECSRIGRPPSVLAILWAGAALPPSASFDGVPQAAERTPLHFEGLRLLTRPVVDQ